MKRKILFPIILLVVLGGIAAGVLKSGWFNRGNDNSLSVSGNLELTRLEDLLSGSDQIAQEYQAATVGGLVSEIAGRIPLPGEVIVADSLRFEVVASTDRRIERVRVSSIDSDDR